MAPGAKNKFGAPMVKPAPPWSKFGAPMFEAELFPMQICWIEESTCDIVGTFRRPRSELAPGELCPPCPSSLRPWLIVLRFSNSTCFLCKQQTFLKYLSAPVASATSERVFEVARDQEENSVET